MKRYILPLAFLLVFGACSEDDKPDNCEYQRELRDFESKLDLFAASPNVSSCNALRQSSINLLNRLDRCPGVQDTAEGIRLWREVNCNSFGS